MTYRPSSVTKQHRLQSADPVRTACARSFPARQKAATTPKRTALSGSPAGFTVESGVRLAISRTTDAAAAPIVRTLSP